MGFLFAHHSIYNKFWRIKTSVFGDFFSPLSQTASPQDFSPTFNTITGDPSIVSMSSLSGEYPGIVAYVRRKLGEPILDVELDNSQIAMAFEESNYEYSRIVNMYHVESYFANLVGIKRNYNLYDLQNHLPSFDYSVVSQIASWYAEHANPYVGNRDIRIGYIDMQGGIENYDVFTNGFDNATNQPLEQYFASVSGQTIQIQKVYHGTPPVFNRYYDPYSINSLLNTEFNYQSYPTETVFYMLPVWNDLLRMNTLANADYIRKSHYQWLLIGRRLQILPRPIVAFRVFFEYIIKDTTSNLDPVLRTSYAGLSGLTAAVNNVVATNLSNVPITDITYANCNSIAKQWIRKFALYLSMEMLGMIRAKLSNVPLTHSETITLNGGELITEAQSKQTEMITELKEELAKMDMVEVLEKEARKQAALMEIYKAAPMPIFKI